MDIVERLFELSERLAGTADEHTIDDTSAEITRLRSLVERQREAFVWIERNFRGSGAGERARTALEGSSNAT